MAEDKGYYIFSGSPTELKTDQLYTYKMTTSGGDMTDVTYEFKWEFTCDGVTTKETIASGLTSLTYDWTATSAKFGPLMKNSKSGTLKLIVATSTGKMEYSKVLPLTMSDSIKPSISGITITRTNDFNECSVSNITSHKLSFNVIGLYGATQTVTVVVGDNNYTKSINAVTDNTVTKVEFDIGKFDSGASDIYKKTITIRIADSRNNVTNASTSIDIYKYMWPTVEATVYRDANKQAYIAFTPTIQTTVAGKANSISNFYATSMIGEGITKVETSLETSPQKLNGTDDIAKSYNIYVYLTDAVGGEGSTNLFLHSDIPIIDIGSDGKTVTFFGTSPTTATKESVNICNSIYMTSREISINSDPNDEFITKTQITTHSFSLSDVITLAIDSDGYSFTEASIRISNVMDSGEIPAKDIVLRGDGSIEAGYIHTGWLRCDGDVNMDSGATISGTPLYINTSTYTKGSISVSDSTGIIGVEIFRDSEGGQINIFPPQNNTSPNTTPPIYWAMDAYDGNLRFYHYDDTKDNYAGNNKYAGPLSLTADGNVVVHNLLSGNNATFTGIVYASTFQSSANYTQLFNINCQWSDGAIHGLLTRNEDGLYAAVGWAGDSSHKTTIRLRGQTCQYANASGTTTLSDERLKDDFQSLDKWEGFFDNLEPCAFKLKNGSSGRYHFGFKAQQVKESLEKSGLTTKDFAGFVTTKYDIDKDDPETTKLYEQLGIKPGDDVHGLIYTEFVALQHNEIQKLKERVKNLETKLNALKL